MDIYASGTPDLSAAVRWVMLQSRSAFLSLVVLSLVFFGFVFLGSVVFGFVFFNSIPLFFLLKSFT